ncbi:MAG: endonuclease III [Gemmatimonadetes bacterium]|nr:endonuclease III [Gemmatimonadota bacterium]
MRDDRINDVLRAVKRENRKWGTPVVELLNEETPDPFLVLISCILSLRTKDETTEAASRRLFATVRTPAELARLTEKRIEKLIYPVGFYKNKTKQIREIAKILVRDHESRVPETIEELTAFKGVGRKTANLVMTTGHGLYGICVDIHVHRIANRWGYVATKTPDETEFALREKLPRHHWKKINQALVTFGQNVCKPVSPWCSRCPLDGDCARIGVGKTR